MLKNEKDYPSPETDQNDMSKQSDQSNQSDQSDQSDENQFNWNTTFDSLFGHGRVDLSFQMNDSDHISYYNPYAPRSTQDNQECVIS